MLSPVSALDNTFDVKIASAFRSSEMGQAFMVTRTLYCRSQRTKQQRLSFALPVLVCLPPRLPLGTVAFLESAISATRHWPWFSISYLGVSHQRSQDRYL